jgi:hypothetical protein
MLIESCCHRYLNSLFVSVDANFKLKLKNRNAPDVSLDSGLSYYVVDSDYKSYYKMHETENEVSNTVLIEHHAYLCRVKINYCQSNLHAVDHANKRSKAYSANGVGAAKCARHNFICPNGVGDLPRGEK